VAKIFPRVACILVGERKRKTLREGTGKGFGQSQRVLMERKKKKRTTRVQEKKKKKKNSALNW